MEENKINPRKEWKRSARQVIKTHYILLVLVCAVLLYYGTEFGYVRANAQNMYQMLTTHDIQFGQTLLKGFETSLDEPSDEVQSAQDAVLESLVNNDAEAGRDKADEQMQEYADSKTTNEITGRKNGIFAGIANTISSGRLFMILYDGFNSIFKDGRTASVFVIILDVMFSVAVWVFLKNLISAIARRICLEARLYEQVPVAHVLHFRLVKRWIRASLTMLTVYVMETLWWYTIVGGVIKHYSYRMVPFIVAENPDIKPLKAITLSRKMMDGHKWECFKLDLSFFLWNILGLVTFGITDFLWTAPYTVATLSEYYAYVRAQAKEAGVEGTERLDDIYLFEKAEEQFLRKTYSDVEEQKHFIDEHRVTLEGKKAFFAKNFGLWFGSTEEKKMYDEVDTRRQQIVEDRAVIKGKIYPQRLNPLWLESNNNIVRNIRYIRTYTIWSVILVFFAFAFVGWCWEVGLHVVTDGVFVNRGFFHGPWLPIYGGGVAMIVVLLARWRANPPAELVSIVVLCGCVEYFTSLYLEVTKGMRWWDYTGYFLNLNGRICGEGLLVFAVGGMAAVYILVPILDAMWSRLNRKIIIPICIVLLVAFAVDFVYSAKVPNVGDGITDYAAYTEVEDAGPAAALPGSAG